MNKPTFIFRAKLAHAKKIYRDIEILQTSTLYDFAVAIIDAFDFEFDHCFGFYSGFGTKMYDSDEVYELFVDIGEKGPSEKAKSVKKTKLRDVFTVGKKMLFYFDYGDDWQFEVVCQKKSQTTDQKFNHTILNTKGDSPEQYPYYE